MYNRHTTANVRLGKLKRKNRWDEHDVYHPGNNRLVIDRRRPGEGYRHLLKKRDLEDFLSLIPDWHNLSEGLNAIVLGEGEDCMGWHDSESGVIGISAWETSIVWYDCEPEFYHEHKDILKRLEIPAKKRGSDYQIFFTESSARAFQLLHVFLHELGHHYDKMSSRLQEEPTRGEAFAEAWAADMESKIFDAYLQRFGI